MTGLDKLLSVIESEEGYNIRGTIPNRRNNPGDLRHGPNAQHNVPDPITGELIKSNDIGYYTTIDLGRADAKRQYQLDASRRMTMWQFVYTYAPPEDGNNSEAYLKYVCTQMQCTENDYLSAIIARIYNGIS